MIIIYDLSKKYLQFNEFNTIKNIYNHTGLMITLSN